MATTRLRIGIVGCGLAARDHLDQLLAIEGVRVVGCADPDLAAAQALAGLTPADAEGARAVAFADHRELLRQAAPEAVAVFTPHREHYRPAMDALQAGCHVFLEKPLSTNVQEASDIVSLAKGRDRKVGVGYQYRLLPSLAEARRRLEAGAIGPVRLIAATLARPWLAEAGGPDGSWRSDPKVAGGGILADAGDHLLDALLWTTGRAAVEVAAFQDRLESGLDAVTAASVRLADGALATVALSGISSEPLFELTYFGERGRLRATDRTLEEVSGGGAGPPWTPSPLGAEGGIDANFVEAVASGAPMCCPGEQALETVRLLEAVIRSAATGQVVRLA